MAGGIGFAGVIPLAISLAQHLLPHRTSLASSLMMGGAWTVAATAPTVSEWCLGAIGMTKTFALAATILAVSGLVGLLLPGALLRHVGSGDANSSLH